MNEDPPGSPAAKKETEGGKGGRRKGAGRPRSDSTRTEMQAEQYNDMMKEKEKSKVAENALLLDHSLLGGEKGKTMGEGEVRMALALIIGLRVSSTSNDTTAVDYASFLLGKSKNTLWSLWNHWKEKKEIFVQSTEKRGAGSPLHPLHHIQLESEHIAAIHRTIWAKVKKFVAHQYTSDRSLEITRMQTLDGFYGSPPHNYAGITSNYCNSCINHVIKYCDWFCYESIAGIEKMMDLVNENFLPPANQEEEEGNDDQLQVSDNENDDSDEE